MQRAMPWQRSCAPLGRASRASGNVPPVRGLLPDRLDVYTLRSLAGPMFLSLGVLLLAQLLERLLRLFDMAASTGAGLDVVLRMAGALVPHYLGLAIPTAFFAAIFMTIARFGDDSELDVMLSTGRSITRVAMPYFAVGLLLSVFNLYLFGYLQPLSRYGYRVAAHDAVQSRWDGRLEDRRFISAGHGFTLSADKVDNDGHGLHGVFVQRLTPDGEEVVTAPQGRLVPSPSGLGLELTDGLIVRDQGDGSVSLLRFARGRINDDFSAPAPFRDRGDSVRELTLPELWRGELLTSLEPEAQHSKRSGEFHGRLARIFLPPLLPLLALPLGMAAKRGRRAPGVVFAAIALLALNHALQFGESLAESGRASALWAVWTPYVLFGVLGVWLFYSSLRWPGDNPVMRTVNAIENSFEGMGRKRKRAKA
jgi:lipopolysaccharide export system permease protein